MRAPELTRRGRTIARVALLLLALGTIAGTAGARPAAPEGTPERIIFPLVGPAQWTDDFGDPRPQGGHEGNDVLSDWKAPVVAVEPGKIRFWNSSSAAGCMLYLYGKSGTTYLYIHLNNDLTAKNDGKGGCKPGVSFAASLADGDRVKAGQLIGYVGSSGDAGATDHLHFELHPGDGAAVSPFRWLKRAERLLYVLSDDEKALAAATQPTLTLIGTVLSVEEAELPPVEAVPDEEPPAEEPAAETSADASSSAPAPPPPAGRVTAGSLLTIAVSGVSMSSGGSWTVERSVTVVVGADAVVERTKAGKTRAAKLAGAEPGEAVSVTTSPLELSLQAQLARPGTLGAARIELRGEPTD